MERKVTLQNKELVKLLIEKGELLKEAREITEEITSLETKREPLGYSIQKLKDKIIPAVESKRKDLELGEFEDIKQVDVDGKDVVITVVDVVAEFKDNYKKAVKERDEKDSKSG